MWSETEELRPMSGPRSESSVVDRKDHVPTGYPWKIYGYTLIISLGGFASGYTVSNIGAAILYIPNSIPLNVLETTLVVSMVLIGALLGSFASGLLADRFGRKPIIVVSALVGAIASLGIAFSRKSWHLVLGRFLVGLAVGALTVLSGLFLAEASPAPIRGSLQGYGHLSGWVGGILAHGIGILFIYLTPGRMCWRLSFGLGAIFFAPAAMATLFGLPESPRWLVSKGHDARALEILRGIYGVGREQQVLEEYRIMQHFILGKHSHSVTLMEFFRAEHRSALSMAFILQMLQQLSGNNMITFYSSIILHDLGFSRESSVIFTGLSVIPQVLIIWFVVHHMDKIGRRSPLLVSIIGTALSLVVLAAMIRIVNARISTWFSLTGILLNRIFYSIGLGPLPAVVAAEILPFNIRGKGLAASMAVGEVFKILSVTAFLPLIKILHPSYLYGTLAIFMVVGFVYTVGQLKETKGKPLDVSLSEYHRDRN